jgi:hypothetical protein
MRDLSQVENDRALDYLESTMKGVLPHGFEPPLHVRQAFRGLLQIKYEASTVTLGLRTAEADRKITRDRVTELTISYEFHFLER